ncbi:MAG: hypothetical protein PHC66_03965 [Candidatus Nanoarchaeia archaeon]|nr:hypothetical protein [Candidatus Nanoarchaeia archaeon]MDD5239374.1 hypothetical protein [Candidatus Nanoarchaeia archaeon]
MAFNFFKKKEELNYPEEKASVLDQPFGAEQLPEFGPPPDLSPEPQMGELPPPPEGFPMPPIATSAHSGTFGEGFVPLDRMVTPEPSRYPQMESSMSASMRPPEEEPMPEQGSLFTPMPKQSFSLDKPHVFVRINKYKEVMDAINELHRRVQDAKKDLDDIHAINTDETSKLREAAEVILKIEDILRYLETTFSSPEA